MSIELVLLAVVSIASLDLNRRVKRGARRAGARAPERASRGASSPERVSPPHARERRARRTTTSMERAFLDDLRARFDAQGYVVVENYLDTNVVEACREELDAVLRCAREGAGAEIPTIRRADGGH